MPIEYDFAKCRRFRYNGTQGGHVKWSKKHTPNLLCTVLQETLMLLSKSSKVMLSSSIYHLNPNAFKHPPPDPNDTMELRPELIFRPSRSFMKLDLLMRKNDFCGYMFFSCMHFSAFFFFAQKGMFYT